MNFEKFPICVCNVGARVSLKKWREYFEEQGIPTYLRRRRSRLELWRALTPQELKEIERGEYRIEAGSFKPESKMRWRMVPSGL